MLNFPKQLFIDSCKLGSYIYLKKSELGSIEIFLFVFVLFTNVVFSI